MTTQEDNQFDTSTKQSMIDDNKDGGDGAGDSSKKTRFVSANNKSSRVRKFFKKSDNLLVSLTVAAVVFGVIVGLAVRMSLKEAPSKRVVQLVGFPGELLMNMLKMLIIPLIISSLITGMSSLDSKSSGRIGMWSLIYYFSTTAMAVVLGIILVLTIRPGRGGKTVLVESKEQKDVAGTLDAFMDLFRNLFPANIVEACISQVQSQIVDVSKGSSSNNSQGLSDQVEPLITLKKEDTTNVLGLVTFSIAFGVVLNQMGSQAKLMVDFFVILNEIVMRLVHIIMWYSPFGIFSLIIGKILSIKELAETAQALGLYMLVVILGLIFHACGTLAIIFYLVTRKNPAKFFKGVFQAWVTALGTASSAATLPVTFKCLEENNKIDPRVTRFVLPIGATINMDGTALYEAVATIFIAQINGIPLEIGQVLTISLTATLAAIGAASVPSAGLVTMILVLTSAGLPTNDISLILTVDWMLDRLRTSVNVLGDAFGAGIVAHLCRDDLATQATPPSLEGVISAQPRLSITGSPDAIEMMDSRRQSHDHPHVHA